MKALIISGANLDVTPYAFLYISHLKRYHAQIEVAVWDRKGGEQSPDASVRLHVFTSVIDNSIPKARKIAPFLQYRRFLKRILMDGKYDLVVALDTQFAVLVSDLLFRYYPGRFVYDMRDLSLEGFAFYRKRMNRLVKESAVTFVSSDGYRQFFLDNSRIFTLHNYQENDLHYSNREGKLEKHHPIRITFWGYVRELELNKRIVSILGNDGRFRLAFHGASPYAEELRSFAEENGYTGVSFSGYYTQNERFAFSEQTDLIHNLYPNGNGFSNPIMTNKYYDGLIFKIPQVCMYGGFMGARVEKEEVGIMCRVDETLPDVLYDYYMSLDLNKFGERCGQVLSEILEEQNRSLEQLHRVIEENLKTQ